MSGRQQRDVVSALKGLWYRPGSQRVGHGWVQWKSINGGDSYRASKLHDSPWCHTLPDGAEVHGTDVFNHSELGDYVVNPRNGARVKRPEPCTWCVNRGTCKTCGKPEARHKGERTGLCRTHHLAVIRPSRAKVRVGVSSLDLATTGGR